jgi:acetyl esterase/lipase
MGVHVAAINYRFRKHAPIQDILRDSARAIQFIRSKAAEWNVDRKRIAAYGGSAGAGTSLWLGAHDDLAIPASQDPVLRESSRLSAAGCLSTQATYDLTRWEPIVGPFKPEWLESPDEIPAFYHFKSKADLETPEGRKILADCDMLGLLSKGDAPVYASNGRDGGDPKNRGHYLHHPNHALAIKKRCDEVGVECVLGTEGRESLAAFLLRHLWVTK